MVTYQAGDVRVVFDDEDAGFHGEYCSGGLGGAPSLERLASNYPPDEEEKPERARLPAVPPVDARPGRF